MGDVEAPSIKDIVEAAQKAYDFLVGEGKDVEFQGWDSPELANEGALQKKLAAAAKDKVKVAVEAEGKTFEEDKLVVQVESQPAVKQKLTLTRHARIMGKLFTCLSLPFEVSVDGGTFQVLYDGEPVSAVGHWVGAIHLGAAGTIDTTALAEGKVSISCSGTTTDEGASHEVTISFSGGKGRGALVWNPSPSTDKFTVNPDRSITITQGPHLS